MNENIKVTTPVATNNLRENRIIAPIVLGVALLIAIFATRPLYMSYIEDEAKIRAVEAQYETLSKEHEALSAIKNSASGSISEIDKKRIDKISKKYNRGDILSTVMLSDYTRSTQDGSAPIALGSVSLGEMTKLPNGLSLSKIAVSVRGRTIDDIIAYITYLTTETPFAFVIEDISLPIDTAPEGDTPSGYTLALSLGLYSYE